MVSVLASTSNREVLSADQFLHSASNTQKNADRVLIEHFVERRQARIQAEVAVPRSYVVAARVDNLSRAYPLRFRVPSLALLVSDEDQDGVLVVTDAFSRVYGEGEDQPSAINDYFLNLRSHFLDLERREDALAPGLQRDLAEMRRYVAST